MNESDHEPTVAQRLAAPAGCRPIVHGRVSTHMIGTTSIGDLRSGIPNRDALRLEVLEKPL